MLTALFWWGPNGVREWDRRMMKDRTREIERREGRKGRLGRATEGWETGMGGPQFTPTNNVHKCVTQVTALTHTCTHRSVTSGSVSGDRSLDLWSLTR